ncbi:hypothetical protein QYF61_006659 [Mycteria americana]|uniref:Large ribosomal subunit protein mL51 n=1 Tax=Mycteria americana TaxID=33587 RepID=A0AAN7PCN3_MYCAM|nr:hypothetical protein QYF61_006659 [Mycteria americana]
MAVLVQAAGRALLGRAAPLLRAERSISGGGGARWGPVRPGLPVPLSSPLAGLTRAFRIKEPPKPKQVDRWTEKRALFGVYDNVGILGKTPPHTLPSVAPGREGGPTCGRAAPPAARGRGGLGPAGLGTASSRAWLHFVCSALLFSGGFQIHPKNLIVGPKWLRGWRGNELQRCIRKKQVVGDRMFVEDYHKLNKRIRVLPSHPAGFSKPLEKKKPNM